MSAIVKRSDWNYYRTFKILFFLGERTSSAEVWYDEQIQVWSVKDLDPESKTVKDILGWAAMHKETLLKIETGKKAIIAPPA